MRGKVAFVLGFAGGYYLGTKAGRERYEQLRRRSAKAVAAGKLAVERVRRAKEDAEESITGV